MKTTFEFKNGDRVEVAGAPTVNVEDRTVSAMDDESSVICPAVLFNELARVVFEPEVKA
jgi:hypothetical protein